MAKWDFSKIDDDCCEEPKLKELKRPSRRDYLVQEEVELDWVWGRDGAKLTDNVNNPPHYGQGKIEAIEYISDFLTPEEYQGYLRGNIAKYLHRFPYKNGVEDLRKASWYLDRLIKETEK